MTDFNTLKKSTDEFFNRHWNVSSEHEVPTWKNGWPWQGSVPYHNKGGVYALFDSQGAIVYIGLGASRGGGIYKEHGISRRLLAHVITTDKVKGKGYYVPRKAWGDVRDIAAIGFPKEYKYLAPALEDYLIGELNPTRNKTKTKAGGNLLTRNHI